MPRDHAKSTLAATAILHRFLFTEEDKPEFVRFNGGCYRWVDEAKTWNEAEQDCSQQGAHLVSIWDGLEQAYAFANVKSSQSWIGLKKEPVGIA